MAHDEATPQSPGMTVTLRRRSTTTGSSSPWSRDRTRSGQPLVHSVSSMDAVNRRRRRAPQARNTDSRSTDVVLAAVAPDQKIDAEDLAPPGQRGASRERFSSRFVRLFFCPGAAIPAPGPNWPSIANLGRSRFCEHDGGCDCKSAGVGGDAGMGEDTGKGIVIC